MRTAFMLSLLLASTALGAGQIKPPPLVCREFQDECNTVRCCAKPGETEVCALTRPKMKCAPLVPGTLPDNFRMCRLYRGEQWCPVAPDAGP